MTSAKRRPSPWQAAERVLRDAAVTSAPVMVQDIATKRGLQITAMPLEAGLSGMIFMREKAPIVVVNSTHPRTRQRFTIAHELGHFELHMREIGTQVHVDKNYFALARDEKSSEGRDRMEIEANRFAAELLVPRHMLIEELDGRVIDVEDEGLVSEIAKVFQVSRQMMAIRIGALATGLTP